MDQTGLWKSNKSDIMENISKNIILLLILIAWFVATVMIWTTIIGFILLIIVDEWWEFPSKILNKIE